MEGLIRISQTFTVRLRGKSRVKPRGGSVMQRLISMVTLYLKLLHLILTHDTPPRGNRQIRRIGQKNEIALCNFPASIRMHQLFNQYIRKLHHGVVLAFFGVLRFGGENGDAVVDAVA